MLVLSGQVYGSAHSSMSKNTKLNTYDFERHYIYGKLSGNGVLIFHDTLANQEILNSSIEKLKQILFHRLSEQT